MNCGQLQDFVFSRPIPGEDVINLLQENKKMHLSCCGVMVQTLFTQNTGKQAFFTGHHIVGRFFIRSQ